MRQLTILTIVFNFFIFIGSGHGIGFIGLLEIMAIKEGFMGNVIFNLTGSYADRLPAVAILNIIGQSLLLSGLFFKNAVNSTLIITGCFTLFIATYILTKDCSDMNIDMISLLCSIPFIVTGSILLIKEIVLAFHATGLHRDK